MKPHRFEHGHKANLVSEERRKFQPAEGIIERAGVAGDETVADLGCGNGYLTLPLSSVAWKVIAIDAQVEMLNDLMERAGNGGDRIRPVQGELPTIPLKEGCLDRVFLVNFLHELHDKSPMISEMLRVLRNGGKVTFVDFQKKETVMGPPLHERIAEPDVPGIFRGFELVERHSFDGFYQFEFRKP